MKIAKHGKKRNRGDSLVFEGAFKKIERSTIAKKVNGKVIVVPDDGLDITFDVQNGDTQHVYEMHLDAEDLEKILSCLSNEPATQALKGVVGALIANAIR